MSDAASMTLVDGVVGTVLAVAIVRGVWIGLIRETFSIAALGAAVLAARYGAAPGGAWLTEATGGETGPFPPEWMAGTGLAIGAALGVAAIGAFVRRGARWVGLSWADRALGGALGAAEGIVVGMLIVLGTTFAIGRQHPVVQESRSLAAYDALRDYVERSTSDLPDVAAPAKNWP
jgi:uncharacterized membrane protein required for colicin V production